MFPFKEIRESRGLTQKYIAISLGVKAPSVSNWEKGHTAPTLDNIISLAKILHVSTDELLGIEAYSDDQSDSSLSEDEKKLVQDYRSLNRQGQEYIRQTMHMAVPIYIKHSDVSELENKIG